MKASGWPLRLILALALAVVLGGWTWHRARSIRAAREAFERQAWLQAIVHARAHLADQPEDDAARRIVAWSHARLGQWQDAETAFAALAEPTADDLRERGDGLIRQSRWFEASYVFELLLNVRPDDPYALQQLAVLRAKQGRELEAIRIAKQLADLAGSEGVGHAMLATLHQNRDNLIGAIESWKRVIEADPAGKTLPKSITPEKVRLDLADCLLKLGRWEEALPHLDYVEERWPEESQVIFLRGWAYLFQGEVDRARSMWERVLRATPDAADVLTKLGELELQTGRDLLAIQYLKRADEVRPNQPSVHAALASAYRATGDIELSREHLARSQELARAMAEHDKASRFLKLDPSSAQGKLAMGIQLARDGKWQDAEVWVREALKQAPDDPVGRQVLQDILARRPPPELNIQ